MKQYLYLYLKFKDMKALRKLIESFSFSELKHLEKQEYIWQREMDNPNSQCDNDYCLEQLDIIYKKKKELISKLSEKKQRKYK
jgi:hypothetical protein